MLVNRHVGHSSAINPSDCSATAELGRRIEALYRQFRWETTFPFHTPFKRWLLQDVIG
jgi:hypothetical protein